MEYLTVLPNWVLAALPEDAVLATLIACDVVLVTTCAALRPLLMLVMLPPVKYKYWCKY